MNNTIENKILKKMLQKRKGNLFFTKDFAELGDGETHRKALERLTKRGEIMRVSRGIYAIPQKSKLSGTLTPSYSKVIRDVLKRDKAKVIPTGSLAKNLLGLSTQVPMKTVYLTNGSPRKLQIGKMTVIFKRTSPKNLSSKGKLSTLAIQALKTMKKDNVTDEHIEKIVTILKNENQKYLAHDIQLAPNWIAEIMSKALSN
jgi:hypothetical protein